MLAELRAKSQITIPKEIITSLGLSEGDKLDIYEKDGMICIMPVVVYDEHFYIDLVFYNYILKCFVLIDLKIGRLTHQDIGQMYVNYYTRELMNDGDNPPIGIVLCAEISPHGKKSKKAKKRLDK